MDLQVELEAIHENLTADTRLLYISQKQAQSLASLMTQGLGEGATKAMRIRALQIIAGPAMKEIYSPTHVITSTKNLTGPVASFLIT